MLLSFALYDDAAQPDDTATPVVAVYVAPDGTAVAPPSVANLGSGLYGFEASEADETEGRAYRIDTGSQPAHLAGSLGRARFVGFGLYDSSGAPLSGASPTFAAYLSTGGAPLTPPVIAELGGGLYGFRPSDEDILSGGIVYSIDTGAEPAHLGGGAGPADFEPVTVDDPVELRIFNLALMRVGSTALISSVTEDSTEARLCRMLYPDARDEVLAAHHWPFASRRAALSPLVGQSVTGWRGAWALPADCHVVQDLWSGRRAPPASQRVPFELQHGVSGQVLLTDATAPDLRYTARVTDGARYPAPFREALAWRLACDLVLSLPVKPQLGPMCFARYQQALGEARAAGLRTGQEDMPPESEFIRARG